MIGPKIARLLFKLFVGLTAHLEIHGLEHLYELKSGILAGNHIGRLDAALIFQFSNRDDIIMMVAEKYQENVLVRWFVRQLNAIFVDRYNADFTVLRKVLKRLEQGGVLVLSPEGTRSPNARLQAAWPGASYLAMKAGVPIVPVGLAGSEDSKFFRNLRRLRRTDVVIRVGKPFTLTPISGENRDAALKNYNDEIMCRIAALLPSEYRGVYRDHPRLHELLNSDQPD